MSVRNKAFLFTTAALLLTVAIVQRIIFPLINRVEEIGQLEKLVQDADQDIAQLKIIQNRLNGLKSSVVTTEKNSLQLKEEIVTSIVSLQDTMGIRIHEVSKSRIFIEKGFEIVANKVTLTGNLVELMKVQAILEQKKEDFNILSTKYYIEEKRDDKILYCEVYLESYRSLN